MRDSLLAMGLILLGFGPALAEAPAAPQAVRPAGIGPWVETGEASVRLVAATAAPDGGGRVTAGIHIQMTEGWHTYWRSLGDVGLPPLFDWSGSANLAQAEVIWPVPRRHIEQGLESFVYYDEVLLPVRLQAKDPGQPVALRLKLIFGVCREICIPAEAEMALDLAPAGKPRPTAAAPLIERYAMRAPAMGDSDDLQVDALDGEQARFRAGSQPFDAPFAILERADGAATGFAPLELSPDRMLAIVRFGRAAPKPGQRLLLIDGGRGLEIPVR